MTAVRVSDHPVVAHRLAQMRDRRTGSDTFRQLIAEVSGFLCMTCGGPVDLLRIEPLR